MKEDGRIRIGLKGCVHRDGKYTQSWEQKGEPSPQEDPGFSGIVCRVEMQRELRHDMTASKSTPGSTQPSSSAICHNNISIIRCELNTDLIYQIMF